MASPEFIYDIKHSRMDATAHSNYSCALRWLAKWINEKNDSLTDQGIGRKARKLNPDIWMDGVPRINEAPFEERAKEYEKSWEASFHAEAKDFYVRHFRADASDYAKTTDSALVFQVIKDLTIDFRNEVCN